MREYSSILDNTIICDTMDTNIRKLKLSGGHSIFFFFHIVTYSMLYFGSFFQI